MLAPTAFSLRIGGERTRLGGQTPTRYTPSLTKVRRADRPMGQRVVSGRHTAMTQTHLGLGSGAPRLDDVEAHVDRETPAPMVALPYAALIKAQLAAGDVRAARTLLDAALRGPIVSDELRRLKKVLAPPRVTTSATGERERSAEYAWLARHAHDYSGQWVALDGERLLAHGRRLKEVLDVVKTMGLARTPLVHRVE